MCAPVSVWIEGKVFRKEPGSFFNKRFPGLFLILSAPSYMASMISLFSTAMTLRRIFKVDVVPPASIVKSFYMRLNYLILSKHARSFEASLIRFW